MRDIVTLKLIIKKKVVLKKKIVVIAMTEIPRSNIAVAYIREFP